MGQCTKNKNLLVSLKNYANLGGGGGTKVPQKHCCLMQSLNAPCLLQMALTIPIAVTDLYYLSRIHKYFILRCQCRNG